MELDIRHFAPHSTADSLKALSDLRPDTSPFCTVDIPLFVCVRERVGVGVCVCVCMSVSACICVYVHN